MIGNFDLLSNLPLLIFSIVVFVLFIFVLRGAVIFLSAGENLEKKEKGKEALINTFIGFCITLLIILTFFLITYLLKKGGVFEPQQVQSSGEFPSSPATNFPPAPEFLAIGGYYFSSPLAFSKNSRINSPAIYTVLCKKNDNYDTIFIGETTNMEDLLKNAQYQCWIKECGKSAKDLYLALFQTPKENYDKERIKTIKESIEKAVTPKCAAPK